VGEVIVAGVIGLALMQRLQQGGLGQAGYVPTTWYLRLFLNNIVPASTDLVAGYTESVAPGYAAIPLTPALWTYLMVGPVPTARYPLVTFSFSGGDVIYGYYLTDAPALVFGGAERWAGGPKTIPSFGATLPIYLEIDLVSP
jgi:hypothetical protein